MAKVQLTESDWTEIYYALESKATWNDDDKVWVANLHAIMDKIGPDGQNAVSEGVEPC